MCPCWSTLAVSCEESFKAFKVFKLSESEGKVEKNYDKLCFQETSWGFWTRWNEEV